MPQNNPLSIAIDKLSILPAPAKKFALTKLFGSQVKFFGTAGIDIIETDSNKAVMIMKNRKKVQNHLGTVHAAAMSLLAESTTGLLVGANLPGDKLPLMKSMSFQYVKRAAPGALTAVATLTDKQVSEINTLEKGEVKVTVTITDVKGIEPVICDMVWAWIPKRKSNSG